MFQYQSKKQINRKKKLSKIIILSLIIIVLFILGFFNISDNFLNFLGKPIWKIENNISDNISYTTSIVRSKNSIIKENENLSEEIISLKNKMIDFDILKKENEELKDLLGRIPNTHKFVLGNILAKPNRSLYDTLIIDIGARNNISEGDIVYVDGKIPIGFVDEVYQDTSLVVMYSNPGQNTEGFINELNTSVSLLGRGGSNFEMNIPAEMVFNNGTFVVLPGYQSEVIAISDEIISKPTDPEKKILLHSPVNIQNVKWVEVKVN